MNDNRTCGAEEEGMIQRYILQGDAENQIATKAPYGTWCISADVTMLEAENAALKEEIATRAKTLEQLEKDAALLKPNRDPEHMIEHILASLRADSFESKSAFGIRIVQDAEKQLEAMKGALRTLAEALPNRCSECMCRQEECDESNGLRCSEERINYAIAHPKEEK
jgi:hypothetical protein